MTKALPLLAALAFLAGCASTDYGAGRIDSKPTTAGCAYANSPCAKGGKGL
ncbi:MAG: hypothetical protein WBA44_01525 [Mesorhizobium sp.]